MSVYRTPNGKGWRAFLKYRGHRDSRTFTRKTDATRWLTEQRAEIDRGSWLDPARGAVPLSRLFDPWLDSRNVEGSTRANDRNVWAAYVEPRFGRVHVADVSVTMVREWVAGLRTKRGAAAPRTKRDALRVLRGVLEYAVEDGRIAKNPAQRIKVPGTKGTPGQALSLGEFRTFVAKLDERERDIALVLGLAGLRWSELSALDERDVVREGQRVFLMIRRRRVLDEEGKRVTLPGTKRGREMSRTVPLVPELIPLVEARLTGNPMSPLFTSRRGARLDSRNWRREAGWKAACESLGREGLRPHDLRHTAATAWLRMTGDIKAVQALLGHATATMTLDLYSHLLTDTLDRATDLMAARLAEAEQGDAEHDPARELQNADEPTPEGEGS